MSMQEISGLLEVHLAAMVGALPAADENINFDATGQPFWRVNHIPNQPAERALTLDVTEWRGLLQVTLSFPLGEGRGDAQAVGDKLAEHFRPPLTLAGASRKVSITDPVFVGAGRPEEGRWVLPVTVSWAALRI